MVKGAGIKNKSSAQSSNQSRKTRKTIPATGVGVAAPMLIAISAAEHNQAYSPVIAFVFWTPVKCLLGGDET